MRNETYRIWSREEYFYEHAFGFLPKITSYLHEDGRKRPCMIIVPGGGYCRVSPTEGELAALKFYKMGYQTFVLTYTTDPLMRAPLKLQPLNDISRALRYIRRSADNFQIIQDQTAVCGFSAGGHLCASLCVHYKDVIDPAAEYAAVSNRPDAAVLCYPVITAGEKAHRDSFLCLLGREADREELDYMSVEKHVTADTPPSFVWTTAADEAVPVENSEWYVQSCRRWGVPCAFHMFSYGRHGLSLADEDWARQRHMDTYTEEQLRNVIRRVNAKETAPAGYPLEVFEERSKNRMDTPNPQACVWPQLADTFLKTVYGAGDK